MAVAAAERKEVLAMIELGKKKGHLTIDDIHTLLPMDVTSPDQIDDFMEMLEQHDIQVLLDPTEKGKKGKRAKAAPAAKPEEAKEEKKDDDKDEETQQEDYGKSNDPVRMYLRKMGSVSLLTREGDVENAKRIEDGANEVPNGVLDEPFG